MNSIIIMIINCFIVASTDIISSFEVPVTITFSPTETVKTFQVQSVPDELQEERECFMFGIESTDMNVSIPLENATTTVCVVDDDCKSVHVYI